MTPKETSKTAPDIAPKSNAGEKPTAVISGPQLRKKELLEEVVLRSGMKKKDVKPVVETMLAVLSDALAENREMVLPPLGKIKVTREKKLPSGRMIVMKLRHNNKPLTGKAEVSD